MQRYTLIGFLTCVVLMMCVPADATKEELIVLRYEPQPGTMDRGNVSIAGGVETTMPGTEQSARRTFRAEIEYARTVLSQTAATTRVETKLLGGTLQMYMPEPIQQQPMDLPASRVVADIGRHGEVVKIVEEDLVSQIVRSFLPKEAWSTTVSIPMTVPWTSCRLAPLTTFRGQSCARLRTRFSRPLKLDASAMAGVGGASGTGTVQGDLLWYYDVNRSVYMYGEGTIKMDVSVDMGETGAMATKMVMNFRSIETGLRQ